jgi:pyruvate dehydrogenase E1 component alpha subunit
MGTHIARGTSRPDDLSVKAAAYGIRTAVCDGMDALATYDCFKTLADATRPVGGEAGGGPVFIDCQTYRYKGHSMSDPQKYRSREEVAQQEHQDPIHRLVEVLTERGVATAEGVAQIDEGCKRVALEAVKFADASPPTPVEELFTDVYAHPYGPPYGPGPAPPESPAPPAPPEAPELPGESKT